MTRSDAHADLTRCQWPGDDPMMVDYHDNEWGVPIWDDRLMFEFLTLEGAQAGLSWQTILRKREGYRRAFQDFSIQVVANFGEADVERLLGNPEIVRNRQKVMATIGNAKAALEVQQEHGSLASLLWSIVGGEPQDGQRCSSEDTPATSPDSEAMSRELRRRGFRFVGPTICYAFMQATGMVNDHVLTCFRHGELSSGQG